MCREGRVVDMCELQIKEMAVTDIAEVIEIERVSFPTPWSRLAYLSELLENEKAVYIVAKQDGKVVGYAGMWIIFDEGHITTLAVSPAVRSRGIGRKLLRTLAALAKESGASRMTLEVRKSNITAYTLYLSEGYLPAGIRPGYYRDNNEDAIIMWKDEI